MHALFVPIYQLWAPHAAADYELMQACLERGDRVTVLSCGGDALGCMTNPSRLPHYCAECLGRWKQGMRAFEARVGREALIALGPSERARLRSVPTRFESVDALRAYCLDTFDLGYGVLSTVVSSLREPTPDLEEHADLVRRLCLTSAAIYLSVRKRLARGDVDRVTIFNGRYASSRAVVRACEAAGVPYTTHERGRDLEHYALFHDTLPHDRGARAALMKAAWARGESDPAAREAIASAWFDQRAAGQAQNWVSFIDAQERGELPRSWREDTRNLVVFNSSEDEAVAISSDYTGGVYPSQLDGTLAIADAFASDPSVHLYLRVHPNLRDVDNSQTRALAALSRPNLTVIPSDSSVSSYALIDHSAWVITFGSTIAMEARYRARPNVSLTPSYYDGAGQPERPSCHDETIALLRTDPEHVDREPALVFGYFMATLGERYTRYVPSGVHDGTFDERPMRPSLGERAVGKLMGWKGIRPAVETYVDALTNHRERQWKGAARSPH